MRRGMLVMVDFWDHAEGWSQAFRCRVYGRLSAVTRKTITLDAWHVDRVKHDAVNDTRYTIVRAAIQRVVRLRPGEMLYDSKGRRND